MRLGHYVRFEREQLNAWLRELRIDARGHQPRKAMLASPPFSLNHVPKRANRARR